MRAAFVVAALATLACGLLRGPGGAAGFALALVGGGLSLWAWWGIVGTAGGAARAGGTPKLGGFLVVLAFLVKLPAFILLYAAARAVGKSAEGCFIFGTILVYFAVTTWAATRAQAF